MTCHRTMQAAHNRGGRAVEFLRMLRPKLLQPRRECIELSLWRRYVVQVLNQLYRGGVVGLTFGGDKCFDLLP